MKSTSVGGSSYRKQEAIKVSFMTHRSDALQALRERCRQSPPFRRLLVAAAYDLVRRGRPKPVLTGNSPQAQRALEKAVHAFSNEHRAQVPEGAAAAWSYLTPKKRKGGTKAYRVITRVSKLEAVCIMHREPSLDGFKVRRLLGYAPDISWRAAAKLNRVHGPPHFTLVEETEDPRDEAFDLDMNENEHFRDDRGFYDEAGVLQPYEPRVRESWESAYANKHEAWNKVHDVEFKRPVSTRFYPAPAAEGVKGFKGSKPTWRIDHHGVSEVLHLRDHRRVCQRSLETLTAKQHLARQLPDAPLYHADLKTVQKNLLEREHMLTLGRRAELDADEAEVLACAERDVPETVLELLEQQVEETSGKTPRGIIAALAQERIKAEEHAVQNQRYVQGLAALERAASQYVMA